MNPVVVQNKSSPELLLVGKHDLGCFLASAGVFIKEIYEDLLGKALIYSL